ncbi:MAG: sarcosine oxidase subunit gamma [Alteromonas macleodii]|jgi:sarcosine oxidase subunit gamma
MSDLAQVMRVTERGMITLRGDLKSTLMKKSIKAVTGQSMPTSGQFLGNKTSGVAWMSPDELLLVVPYADVAKSVNHIDDTLNGKHYLAADVSDARAVFSVLGTNARDVLARVCPVDLHSSSFCVGQFRRTRMAQVAAAFWMHNTGFDVVCFQSVGDYAEDLLTQAAENAVGAAHYT